MFEPKRLHPITVAYDFVRSLKDLIVPFVFIFLFGKKEIQIGDEGSILNMLPQFLFALFVLFVIGSMIVKWYRFTYRAEDNELRIEQGLFVKKKRYIPFERIQSLDLSESILHRPLGLVKVKVETAGSGAGEAEAELTAIRKEDAAALQKMISEAKKRETSSEAETEESRSEGTVIYKITLGQLFFIATTSGRAGVVISAFLAFIFQFEDLIPYETIFKELQDFVRFGVIFVTAVLLVGLFIAWMVSVVIAFFKYNDFTVRKVEDELIITRGLLEKRTTTVPLHRVQAIQITESPIRQPFGYASVSLESAGGSVTDLESSSLTLLPIVRRSQIGEHLSECLPDYTFDAELKRAPQRSIRRYLFVKLVIATIVAGALAGFFWPYGLTGLLFPVIAIVWGYAQFKSAGWNVQDHQLTMRYRGIQQHTMLMKKNRIQSFATSVSWFQKRVDLAAAHAAVKSGAGAANAEIAHLDQQDAFDIYQWYRHQPSEEAPFRKSGSDALLPKPPR